ncbi:GGDEF domain-containing protein [Brevibacillus dissolubilis]|uniref:GGDEF domain-containing protein n=1 Tax=Brevibacillus dissolubilis TaxID=1844116 RepID=UPI00159BECE8|nr:GGDEF domain-containing protein [Brevibacillus dissolubilis]
MHKKGPKLFGLLLYLCSAALAAYTYVEQYDPLLLPHHLSITLLALLCGLILKEIQWRVEISGRTITSIIDFSVGFALLTDPFYLFVYFSLYFLIVHWREKRIHGTFQLWDYFGDTGNLYVSLLTGYILFHSILPSPPPFTIGYILTTLLTETTAVLVSTAIIYVIFKLEDDKTLLIQFREFTKYECLFTIIFCTPGSVFLYYFFSHGEYVGGCFFILIAVAALKSLEKASHSHMERAELESYRKIAYADELTGAYNVRFLKIELNELEKQRETLGLVIGDIDHFKQVNDRYGHGVGDLVLTHCVKVIRQELSADDLLIRSGGEEFTLILKSKTYENCLALLEKIRRKIENTPFRSQGSESAVIPCTMSFGMYFIGKGERLTYKDAIEFADQLLYASKQNGRNRVTAKNGPAENELLRQASGESPGR